MTQPKPTSVVSRVHDTFVVGPAELSAQVRKALSPLMQMLQLADVEDISKPRPVLHFIVAAVDFADLVALQTIAKLFERVNEPTAYKAIYAAAPQRVTNEQLLFAAELGARFTVCGPERDADLRAFIKRSATEADQAGSVAFFVNEIERAGHDPAALQAVERRLSAEARANEDLLKLLVMLNERLANPRRVETLLRKILTLNPQNLWAANTLGKHYLRIGRAADGIEMLKKLSLFQDLNGERLVALGEAYLNCGEAAAAEEVFRKGERLGEDPRFREGMAKARLLQGDIAEALAIVGRQGLSREIVSFLNTRAIMAMRAGQIDVAMRYYKQAVEGSQAEPVLCAKLKFNQALGLLRENRLDEAAHCFQESVTLGGEQFKRARKPLDIVRAHVEARKQKQVPAGEAGSKLAKQLGDEWEVM